MPSTATTRAFPGNAKEQSTDISARVQPNLRDLMSLARAAMHLPGWHERAKRQTQGAYLSALRGRGMEYDESRPYQAGDDIRTLDWRVTARSGKPHTKLFREERERPVYICCDLGRAMRFATQGAFKSVVAARAAALIAWKAQQSGDRIGGVIFNEDAHLEIPPARGKAAVARLLKGLTSQGSYRKLEQSTRGAPSQNKTGSGNMSQGKMPQGQTSQGKVFEGRTAQPASYTLNNALERLERLVKPGSLIFVISDFRQLNFVQQAERKDSGASQFARIARHSDTFAISITDPLEVSAPTVNGRAVSGRAQVSNGIDKVNLVFGTKKSDRLYQQAFAERRDLLKQFCRSNQVRLEDIMTSDEPLVALERLLR